jgi:hypothetical protein
MQAQRSTLTLAHLTERLGQRKLAPPTITRQRSRASIYPKRGCLKSYTRFPAPLFLHYLSLS